MAEGIKEIWSCPDIINNINLEIAVRTELDFTDEVKRYRAYTG